MCVVLSAKMSSVEDPTMADKEAVLATLNINAMTFNKVHKCFISNWLTGDELV